MLKRMSQAGYGLDKLRMCIFLKRFILMEDFTVARYEIIYYSIKTCNYFKR